MSLDTVEKQAKELAADNRRAEPDIEKIYWFPDLSEVRLVGILPTIPASDDGYVHPFYFRADPQENLPFPSGVALIRRDEFGRLLLPERWGNWESAVALDENGDNGES